jgi:hypothetical protein
MGHVCGKRSWQELAGPEGSNPHDVAPGDDTKFKHKSGTTDPFYSSKQPLAVATKAEAK